MANAIQFMRTGGPQVLEYYEHIELPEPKAGEVRVRHSAIGLNYIDTYHRTGLYPVSLPCVPGLEASGVVTKLGEGVTGLAEGQRVAYGRGPLGAYTSERNIAAKELLPIPKGVSDDVAASAMLKGLTAWYLLHQTFPVNKGDTILVHAAAGGVGLILVQWAKRLGCRVIGTAGNAKKADAARAAGCDATILYRQEDVAKRVRTLTDNKGVDVVYDAVGKDTFMASLDSLKPLGMMVSYGQASGPIPPFSMSELAKRGSLFLTRPSLMDYAKNDKTYWKAGEDLLARIARGELKITVGTKFDLKDAAKAHTALEARETVGSTILIP